MEKRKETQRKEKVRKLIQGEIKNIRKDQNIKKKL
jgi:hypothetical protein